MTLRDCAPDARIRIDGLSLPAGDRLRLTELGFVRGQELRVVARGAAGGLLVALGDARIALDADTTRGIRVSAGG
ncbi:ferrous iron transport protein A [Streptomyces gamaensis]|uniref:Ferrous iron transport protein A n=1 Tax=Streptomyces gamaensis TaxID=1763542 RepID=A0ABW0YZN0_9ACTN